MFSSPKPARGSCSARVRTMATIVATLVSARYSQDERRAENGLLDRTRGRLVQNSFHFVSCDGPALCARLAPQGAGVRNRRKEVKRISILIVAWFVAALAMPAIAQNPMEEASPAAAPSPPAASEISAAPQPSPSKVKHHRHRLHHQKKTTDGVDYVGATEPRCASQRIFFPWWAEQLVIPTAEMHREHVRMRVTGS